MRVTVQMRQSHWGGHDVTMLSQEHLQQLHLSG